MDKTPVEVAMFLKENGVSGDICDIFEGTIGAHSLAGCAPQECGLSGRQASVAFRSADLA